MEVVAQEQTHIQLQTGTMAKSGNGLVSINGDVSGLGINGTGVSEVRLAWQWCHRNAHVNCPRTSPDGTPMMDFEGKPIIGPKQLKTQLNLQKASSASSLEKMSDAERAAAIAALTKARNRSAAAAGTAT
ncbi:hypothetical protein QM042_01910 [Escherichia coli]|uniref:hypothetical protein n=1 Tax=Escherichia coli TaxID=562 RepID=UPI0039889F9A